MTTLDMVCKVVLTSGIRAKTHDEIAEILEKVRSFDNFTTANDPYGEHDFGSFDYKGQKYSSKLTITTLITNICQKIHLILQLPTEF